MPALVALEAHDVRTLTVAVALTATLAAPLAPITATVVATRHTAAPRATTARRTTTTRRTTADAPDNGECSVSEHDHGFEPLLEFEQSLARSQRRERVGGISHRPSAV